MHLLGASKDFFLQNNRARCLFRNIRSLGPLDIHVTDLSVSGTAGQTNITKTPRSVPSSVTTDWTKTSTTEIPEPQERPSVSQKLVWGLLSGVLAVLVIALAVAVLLCWNRSRSRRTRKKDKESNGYAHQSTPLMQQRKYIFIHFITEHYKRVYKYLFFFSLSSV